MSEEAEIELTPEEQARVEQFHQRNDAAIRRLRSAEFRVAQERRQAEQRRQQRARSIVWGQAEDRYHQQRIEQLQREATAQRQEHREAAARRQAVRFLEGRHS